MLNVEQKYYYTHARARATTKYGAVRGNLLRISAPQKSNAIPSYFEGPVRRLLAPHPLRLINFLEQDGAERAGSAWAGPNWVN